MYEYSMYIWPTFVVSLYFLVVCIVSLLVGTKQTKVTHVLYSDDLMRLRQIKYSFSKFWTITWFLTFLNQTIDTCNFFENFWQIPIENGSSIIKQFYDISINTYWFHMFAHFHNTAAFIVWWSLRLYVRICWSTQLLGGHYKFLYIQWPLST